MKKTGVGLVGSGFMGKSHAFAWNAVKTAFGDIPTPDLVALAEISDDLARQKAGEFGFRKAVSDWRLLLSDPEIDVISITSPNQFHQEMAIAALEAGKHVWCEKPMGISVADGQAMADVAARYPERVTLLGYNYVQNPMMRLASDIISEGGIGRIHHVRAWFDEDYMAENMISAHGAWRVSLEKAGRGALADMMCHVLSLLDGLVAPVSSLVADLQIVHEKRPIPEGGAQIVENEDTANVLVRFANGATGYLGSSRVPWGRKNWIGLELYGTEGTITFNQEHMNEIHVYQNTGNRARDGFRTIMSGPLHPPYDRFCVAPGHQVGINDLKTMEAAHLLNCIAGKEQPRFDFAKGLKIEKTLAAMVESHEGRKWVDLA